MDQKKLHHMGFGYILLGVLFLWNPIVGFIDVLPDFFGYLLLYVGTYKLADINLHIETAREKLRILLWVGVGQLVAMWFLYSVMGNATEINRYEQPTGILLCSFAMLFFQWYFLIPTFRELFCGMERLAEKYGSQALDRTKRNQTKSHRMITACRVFIIASTVMSLLPELTILTSMEYAVNNQHFWFDWYEFIRMFRIIGCAVGLIFGLIWIVRVVLYFASALKDSEWCTRLGIAYQREMKSKPGLFTVRRFRLFFMLMQIAIVFSINLRLSFHSALPGVGLALIAMLAVFLLSQKIHIRQKNTVYLLGGLLSAVSVAQCVTNYLYLKDYLPEVSLYESTPYYKYLFVQILGCAEALLTFVFILLLITMLVELVFAHTAVEYEGDVTHALSNAATSRLHRSFVRRSSWILVLFFLAAIGNMLDSFFWIQYSWGWLICFAFSIAAIWLFFSMLHELMVQISFRYQLDPMHKKH